jgi:hypothetical protein
VVLSARERDTQRRGEDGNVFRVCAVMPNQKHLFLAAAVALASTVAMPPAEAQLDPEAVRHRNECRLAQQVLTHGQPANRYDWALRMSTRCGEVGGAGLAALIRRHRSETTDTAHFEGIVQTASQFRDQQIFEAALDLVQDGGASPFARVQGARILYHQLFAGTFYRYEDLIFESTIAGGARFPSVSTAHIPVGRPLAPDALDRAADGLAPVSADSSLPRDLRIAVKNVAGDVDLGLLVRRLCGTSDLGDPECNRRMDAWFEEEFGIPEPPDDDDDDDPAGL